MRVFFLPNGRGVALILFVAFLLGVVFLSVPVLAQETEPAPEPPIEVPELPDAGPIIDDTTTDLQEMLTSAEMVIAILVFLVTQLLKYVTRREDVSTQTIYVAVIGVFSVIYFIANLTGYIQQVQAGIDFLSVLANPLWQIIVALVGSGALYGIGRITGNVAMAGQQGNKRFKYDPPKPVQLLTPTTVVELQPLVESKG